MTSLSLRHSFSPSTRTAKGLCHIVGSSCPCIYKFLICILIWCLCFLVFASFFISRLVLYTITHAVFPLTLPCLHLSELRGSSWQVVKVVKPEQLGKPDEMLRELMRKLELSPQKDEGVTEPMKKLKPFPQKGEETLTHTHFLCMQNTYALSLYPIHKLLCYMWLQCVLSTQTLKVKTRHRILSVRIRLADITQLFSHPHMGAAVPLYLYKQAMRCQWAVEGVAKSKLHLA